MKDAQWMGALNQKEFVEEMIRVLTLFILLLQLAVILRMNSADIDVFDFEEGYQIVHVGFGIAYAVHGHGFGVVFVPIGFVKFCH